jgi:hypothetical protein
MTSKIKTTGWTMSAKVSLLGAVCLNIAAFAGLALAPAQAPARIPLLRPVQAIMGGALLVAEWVAQRLLVSTGRGGPTGGGQTSMLR